MWRSGTAQGRRSPSPRAVRRASADLRRRFARVLAPHEPAALLQDAVGLAVEGSRRRVGAFGAAYDALGVLLDAVRDQLPLRNLGRGPHARELLAEGAHSRIGPQRGIAPGLEPRRQIARQAVEAHLLLGAQQKLDQLPRLLLAPRLVTEHKTRATRQRVARLRPGRPG